MKMKLKSVSIKLAMIFAGLAAGAFNQASACTWFDFRNDQGNWFIGRTMEWPGDLQGQITIVPRNYTLGSFKTKYGFVGISHNGGFSDGLNECGLALSGLWLAESKYPEKKEGARPITEMIYVLGNTKTVDEAVAFIKTNVFYSSAVPALPGLIPSLHFAITDASGRSVVVEFIDGKAQIHENKVGAMTNDPRYEEQLKNWADNYAGKTFDEGTFEAFDYSPKGRFCRMAAMNATQAKVPTDMAAVNRAWSMIDTVDIPQGILYWKWASENPQFTSYAVVDDLKNRIYYFRTYDNYDIRKIDLNKIDFATAKYQSASLFGGANYKEFQF
jgi:choloylglycine hydrolase